MTEKQRGEWTGLKGRIGAWYLNGPLRRLSEVLFLGDVRTVFLREINKLIKGGEVVLDVGAGSGYFSLAIAERLKTGKVICLDLSGEMLQRLERVANRRGLMSRVQILLGTASPIKLEDEAVDNSCIQRCFP